jgi:hypothetical protein
VRRRKADLHARVNGDLALRFTGRGLTSFGGLELFRRFLHGLKFSARLRRHLRRCDPSADFSSVTLIRLLLAMLVVGARRIGHVRHLVGDPVIQRFCGLAAWPSDRTVSRWLSRCTAPVRSALQALNAELVALAVRPLQLGRLTIDVDGTVVRTGLQVERAFRGYNPHHRKDKSYYPITAHLAQTGHLLRVQNRSGNVHDGKAGLPFLRDLLAQTGRQFGRVMTEMRLDGAFFRAEILSWLEHRTRYAIKVPFYQWIGLKSLIHERRRWKRVASEVEGFDTTLWLEPWKRFVRVAVYRKRVRHQSPKNYQLDLFDPDDGHWEYSAIATNHTLGLKALWHFMGGRGAHEKVLAELKHGYAFDTVPSRSFAANSTWQILSTLAHNLIVSFQLAVGAPRRPRSLKRTALYVLKSIHTLRYEVLGRAGIVQYPQGRATLTLSHNLPTRGLFQRMVARLA